MASARLDEAAQNKIWEVYCRTGSIQQTNLETRHSRNAIQRVIRERLARGFAGPPPHKHSVKSAAVPPVAIPTIPPVVPTRTPPEKLCVERLIAEPLSLVDVSKALNKNQWSTLAWLQELDIPGYTLQEDADYRFRLEPLPVPQPAAVVTPPPDPVESEMARLARIRGLRDEQSAVKAIAGERSLRKYLEELFTTIAPTFPAPPAYVAPPPPHEFVEETLLLHLSDWHAYEEVKPERVLGVNSYDSTIFGQRARRVVEAVTAIKTKMEAGNGWRFPRLVLALNGDFVSGTIHEVERHSDAPNVVMAVYGCGMVLASVIRDLSAHFEEVEIFCTSGNHGRLGDAKRMQQKDPTRNWDTAIYLFAKTALADCTNLKWFIPDSYSVVYEIFGSKFLQTHGHDIRSWNSIPFYGISRYARNINALKGVQDGHINAFLLAHFHNLGSIEAGGAEYFTNGSLIGGNEYSVNALGEAGKPKQWLLAVHHAHGITHRWPILATADENADGYYARPWEKLSS